MAVLYVLNSLDSGGDGTLAPSKWEQLNVLSCSHNLMVKSNVPSSSTAGDPLPTRGACSLGLRVLPRNVGFTDRRSAFKPALSTTYSGPRALLPNEEGTT